MGVDGPLFKRALLGSLSWLGTNHEEVNRLNVFPVPDGDTGTNMLLTLQSAVEDVKESNAAEVSKIAKLASHGSLMGARGNSGVILSQIFRGFARAVEGKSSLTPAELAAAFEEAANAAYRAVNKPTEGTILTVAREAGRAAAAAASGADTNVPRVIAAAAAGARAAVLKTPSQLQILRDAGVDDTGVAQDLELARRLEHRRARARGGGGDDARNVGVRARGGGRGGATSLARDREDGALRGLVDRAVGGVGRLLERGGELRRRERALALDRAREAAKDLGQDHARVAARAHEAPVRGELGDLAHLRGVRFLHVLDRRLQGQQHVRAGVAVGHRKDVEPVYLFMVGAQPAETAEQRPLEQRAVDPHRLRGGQGSGALFANALNVDVDLDDGHVDRPLDLELHGLLEVVRDLRDADAVLDDDVHVDDQALVGLLDVDALVHVLAAQQLREPIAQAPRGHAADAVAARGGVAGDGGYGRGKNLDPAPLPGLDQGGRGLRGHQRAHGTIRLRAQASERRCAPQLQPEGNSWPSNARSAARRRSTDTTSATPRTG